MCLICDCLYLQHCRFFEDYKKNENKEVKIDDFLNAEEARKAVKQSMVSRALPNSSSTAQSGTGPNTSFKHRCMCRLCTQICMFLRGQDLAAILI